MSGDYEVGYAKPPRHTRFRPGRSGNPKGRPRGPKSLSDELAEELQERIALGEGGAAQTVSKQRAMLKSLMDRAIAGDARSAAMVLDLVHRLFAARPEEPASEDTGESARDRLARKIAQIRKRMIALGEIDPEPGEAVPPEASGDPDADTPDYW